MGTTRGNYGSKVMNVMECFKWEKPAMWIQQQYVLTAAIAFGLTQFAMIGANQSGPEKDGSALRQFLKQYLRLTASAKTSIAIGSVDLNGDNRQEQVVYVRGEEWCGSGGCLALVLRRTKTSYNVLARITVARLPIRVLNANNNGWRSIGVWVQGAGIKRGYEAVLLFNGKKYPDNPTHTRLTVS